MKPSLVVVWVPAVDLRELSPWWHWTMRSGGKYCCSRSVERWLGCSDVQRKQKVQHLYAVEGEEFVVQHGSLLSIVLYANKVHLCGRKDQERQRELKDTKEQEQELSPTTLSVSA